MSKLIRASVLAGRHVIATGDFNSNPNSVPMKIMRLHTGLVDVWETLNPSTPTSPIGPNSRANATAAIERLGLTVDSPMNTWSQGKPLDAYARRWLGKRLDYILFWSPPSSTRLKAEDVKVVMTDLTPGHTFSLSDHFGLEATFGIATEDPGQTSVTGQLDANRRLSTHSRLSEDDLLTVLGALSYEHREANRRSRRLIVYFGASVGILLFVLIGSGFIRSENRWLAPVAAVLGAVAAWAGTTSLYVGFVWGKWETGILENLMNDVEETLSTHRLRHAT